MAMSLAGWRRIAIDGGVMLLPPDQSAGVIQIRHGQQLRPLRELVAHLVGLPVGGQAMQLVASPRAITTDEGEYGALVRLASADGARPMRRTVGVVFGDDWLATVDGRIAAPDRFDDFDAAIERLVTSLGLGLGRDRWRRARYAPPPGWACHQRFRCDVWLAPSFPRAFGAITVFHARPEADDHVLLQHHRLFEALTREFVQVGEPRPVHGRHGMVGKHVEYEAVVGDRDHHATDIVLADGRYLYLTRLETDRLHRDAHEAALLALVDSLDPVPRPRPDLGGLNHWLD